MSVAGSAYRKRAKDYSAHTSDVSYDAAAASTIRYVPFRQSYVKNKLPKETDHCKFSQTSFQRKFSWLFEADHVCVPRNRRLLWRGSGFQSFRVSAGGVIPYHTRTTPHLSSCIVESSIPLSPLSLPPRGTHHASSPGIDGGGGSPCSLATTLRIRLQAESCNFKLESSGSW